MIDEALTASYQCATGGDASSSWEWHYPRLKFRRSRIVWSDLEEGVSLNSLVGDSSDNVLHSLRLWSSSRQFLPAYLQINRIDGQW
jgi:hypothetical protein